MTPPSVCPAPLSPCCGAAIERVYYRFGGMRPCNPDDADYSERVCGECKEKATDGDLSACCHAPCRVEGKTTHYYVCGKCGKPCDVEVSGMDDDALERMDRCAACVNIDLRMLMRDAPEEGK